MNIKLTTSVVMRCMAVAAMACSSLGFAAESNPISPDEEEFIEKSLTPIEQMEMTVAIRTESFPPVRGETEASRTKLALEKYRAILLNRGVAYKAVDKPAEQPAVAKTSYQLDIEFLQANLKPDEWQQVMSAHALAQNSGDTAGFLSVVKLWMGRLAARGVKQQTAAAGTIAPYQPKSKNVRITPTETGEIQVVQILPTGFEFRLPSRDETIPAGATQSVTWIDPADDSKGVKAAGFLAADGSKVGLWLEWNSAWKQVSGGFYTASKQSGEWVEFEYAADPAVETAKHTGSYANGVRTGVWKTEYTREHPLVVEARKKLGANAAGGGITQSLNEMNGYHQTDTYADGTVAETKRDF